MQIYSQWPSNHFNNPIIFNLNPTILTEKIEIYD